MFCLLATLDSVVLNMQFVCHLFVHFYYMFVILVILFHSFKFYLVCHRITQYHDYIKIQLCKNIIFSLQSDHKGFNNILQIVFFWHFFKFTKYDYH